MHLFSEIYWDRGSLPINQDSVSVQEVTIRGEKVIFAVICDGIGGLWKGEVASGYVAEQMTIWFHEEAVYLLAKHKSREKILKAGVRRLHTCNEELILFAKEKEVQLGTTISAILIYKKRYMIWHSGDTQIYQIRSAGNSGRIKKLTENHSVNERTLTKCIGSFAWKQPDLMKGYVKRKTVYLICSDGFRHVVSMERLGEALQPKKKSSREKLYKRMAEIAEYSVRHGEKDNISAVVISAD